MFSIEGKMEQLDIYDKNNIKFNLFDVENYKLAFACRQSTEKIIEYDIDNLYPI